MFLPARVLGPRPPAQVPGLAHLLEHAVHLGTARYPDPKDYKAFLSQHGGSSNASTSKSRGATGPGPSARPVAVQRLLKCFS